MLNNEQITCCNVIIYPYVYPSFFLSRPSVFWKVNLIVLSQSDITALQDQLGEDVLNELGEGIIEEAQAEEDTPHSGHHTPDTRQEEDEVTITTQTTFRQDCLIDNLEVGLELEGQHEEAQLEDQVLLGEERIEVVSELEVAGLDIVGIEVAGLEAAVMFLQWQYGKRNSLIHLL